jgi:phosphonate transport system substrate-binding protein
VAARIRRHGAARLPLWRQTDRTAGDDDGAVLKLLTYLAPSLPAGFFRTVADVIAERAGIAVELRFERRISGPMPGDENPLQAGSADIAFVCAPSYRCQRKWLHLLPVPVPTDERAAGRPVYFCDVVVRRHCNAESLRDLRGCRWAFNDRNSHSGWLCLFERLAPAAPAAFFGATIQAGSHLESLRLIRTGFADAAAIDSNALRHAVRTDPTLRQAVRVLESWGPFPVQPVVMRRALPHSLRASVRDALLHAHETAGDDLRRFGFARFIEVGREHYPPMSATSSTCEAIGLQGDGPIGHLGQDPRALRPDHAAQAHQERTP